MGPSHPRHTTGFLSEPTDADAEVAMTSGSPPRYNWALAKDTGRAVPPHNCAPAHTLTHVPPCCSLNSDKFCTYVIVFQRVVFKLHPTLCLLLV